MGLQRFRHDWVNNNGVFLDQRAWNASGRAEREWDLQDGQGCHWAHSWPIQKRPTDPPNYVSAVKSGASHVIDAEDQWCLFFQKLPIYPWAKCFTFVLYLKNKKAILLSLDFIKPLLEPHEPHIHTSHYSHTHSPDTLSQYTPTASTEYILLLYKRYSTEAIV